MLRWAGGDAGTGDRVIFLFQGILSIYWFLHNYFSYLKIHVWEYLEVDGILVRYCAFSQLEQ